MWNRGRDDIRNSVKSTAAKILIEINQIENRKMLKTFSRAASTATKNEIRIHGLHGRYAHALYAAAEKNNKLNEVNNDMSTLGKQFKEDKNLRPLLSNPLLSKEERKGLMGELCQMNKVNQLTKNALDLVAENGRMKKLHDIVNAYNQITASLKGDVECKITTSKPLGQQQKTEIQGALKQVVTTGNIKVQFVTDENIMGGMIVEIGDKYLDMSVKTKISKFSEIIRSSI
ncbi:hypothetical protein SNEBB_000728 [Seison nebaliae]|nr:hypothetical protein SNEBB_000728 [Seison nebaliae]